MDETEHEWMEALFPATPEGERIANSVDAAIWAGTIPVDSAGRVRCHQYETILAAARARFRRPGEKL